MELAALLAPLGALAPLRRLADPARERSPRVRAAAAIALAPHDPAALARILDEDPDEIPRRAALEEAEPRAEHDEALRRAIERLAVAAPTAELCRLAAEAAERLHHRLDAGAGAALRAAADAIADVPERASARLLAPLPPDTLGRALAVLSTADHGLQAARGRRGWRILRGDRLRRVVWRVLHEVRNPSPDKRQSYGHCVGRLAFGEVRAPAGGLAEVTATKVPGERVVVPALGDWGRHLPTPDDLLAWPRGGRLSLFSAFGITRVRFPSPPRWLAARVALTTRYAAYARLRWRALTGAEWRDRREYLRRLERLGFVFGFEPYRAAGPTEVVELYQPGAPAAAPPAGAAALLAPAGELLRRWLDPATSTVNHLAAVGFATLALFYLRLREARRELERARAAIPLSIGGWGTRGKSGTERLKAALFQALGCEVLVKTTGCEAMLIHCLPGLPAHELFIYRTYDKASIWEQRDLVTLAERLGVDVFLWECMALNPGYVEILEQHWMRDDFCTLTNAYPDHENIQGPAGIDVPRVMARFVPRGRTLFTAEEQMFPIVRDAAAAAETEVVQVRWRDHALLPADLLARFPYEEHPRNIALVLELAARLGVDRTMALKEMADWVVPDLGVLKTYPEVSWRGRRLVFSNGMSANERTGFLNNWARCGFDRHQPDDVGEWIVTVVNNRADRVSRSMVFADVVVDDAAAHAHVLIGTNLTGLVGFIGAALARRVAGLALVHPDEATLPPERLEPLALARAERALKRVMLGELGAGRLAREADAMAAGLGASARVAPETFAAAVVAGQPTLAATRAAVRPLLEPRLASFAAALGAQGADAVRHLLESCARHAAVLRWRRDLAAVLRAGLDALRRHEVAFRALVRELSLATLVPLWDAALSGDQVIDAVTRACPPGYRVRIMGVQNIKGTGLDFAYRWVGLEATARRAAQLEARAGAEAVRLARALAEAEGLGVLDCALAEPAIRAAAGREPEPHRAELLAAAARLHERLAEREAALARTATAATRRWLRPLEELLDVWDGIWRRRRAERVMAELTAGRLAHPTAAAELRELMKRQKGGWLLKR
jgi:poly-gamma-glutamate synthase PgsB/CapB